jgi:hypothetical protein
MERDGWAFVFVLPFAGVVPLVVSWAAGRMFELTKAVSSSSPTN